MAAPVDEKCINLLLLGKTGEGKSSTGNSILGRRLFKTEASSTSVTKECQREMARVQGHNMVVVDSSGLADTEIRTSENLTQLAEEVAAILATQPDGFDAILIVIQFGRRLTQEDRAVFQQLEAFFGQDYTKHYGILVITHADRYDPEENDNISLEEFLHTETGLLLELREKCNNRMVTFNNRTKDESIRQEQVKNLLHLVVEMNKDSNRYTPDVFKEAQKSRDEAILKAEKPLIREKTENSLKLIMQDLEDIPAESVDTEQLTRIKVKLHENYKELVEQDKGTGTLIDIISMVSGLENIVVKRIEAINENCDLKKIAEKSVEQTRGLNKKLEESQKKRMKYIFCFICAGIGGLTSAAVAPVTSPIGVAAGIMIGSSASSVIENLCNM